MQGPPFHVLRLQSPIRWISLCELFCRCAFVPWVACHQIFDIPLALPMGPHFWNYVAIGRKCWPHLCLSQKPSFLQNGTKNSERLSSFCTFRRCITYSLFHSDVFKLLFETGIICVSINSYLQAVVDEHAIHGEDDPRVQPANVMANADSEKLKAIIAKKMDREMRKKEDRQAKKDAKKPSHSAKGFA